MQATEVLTGRVEPQQLREVGGGPFELAQLQVEFGSAPQQAETELLEPGAGGAGGGSGDVREGVLAAPQAQRLGDQGAGVGEGTGPAGFVGPADQFVAVDDVHVVHAGVQGVAAAGVRGQGAGAQ